MDRIRIVGGQRLTGVIPISVAKIATLPLMIASLLTEEPQNHKNKPHHTDVIQLQRILGQKARDHQGQRGVLGAGDRDDPGQP